MIVRFVQRAMLIAAATTACYGLAEAFGPPTAALIWAGIAVIACGVGTVLLRTSPVGRVTWRNRAAGYLIPWGWRLNRGRLWPVAVVSWVGWMAVGAAVFVLRPGSANEDSGVGLRVALFAAWVVDAAALLFVLGTIRQATPGSRVRSLWKLAAVIALVGGASIGLYLGGRSTAALVVGGGPPLAAGGCTGLVVLVFMTVGRNTRWN
jgi:hypothetical protein